MTGLHTASGVPECLRQPWGERWLHEGWDTNDEFIFGVMFVIGPRVAFGRDLLVAAALGSFRRARETRTVIWNGK